MDDRTLTAAANVTDGVMVALVPSAADAARLAVEGGEPVEQLHCTLAYLGSAADLEPQVAPALIAWAENLGNGKAGWLDVQARAFAAALFNPDGAEPCVTLLVSGAELAEFHEVAMADLAELVDLPQDTHQPWIPHITLIYMPPDLAPMRELALQAETLAPRIGDLTFDRLRVAIAGEVYDVPIGPETPAADTGADTAGGDLGRLEGDGDQAPPAVAAAVAAQVAGHPGIVATAYQREVFDGCPRCWGPNHDGACPPAL